MVERRPVRLSSNVTRVSPPMPVAAKQSGNGGWIAIGLIVAALVGISKCSSHGSGVSGTASSNAAVVGTAQQALVSAVTAQTPKPVRELSTASLRRGASRVDLAAREGLAGELIYSQNCYDALGRGFTWNKLDECGGFDVEASLALGDQEPVGSEKEVAWFDGEAAAGRYLKAAIAAGQDADAADVRLSELQRRISSRRRRSAVGSPSGQVDPSIPQVEEPDGEPAENALQGQG